MNPNRFRVSPGGLRNASHAPSIGSVPDPHSGSISGAAPRQPVRSTIAAPSASFNGARVWILAHPHNPLGHVFDRAGLERIAEIAGRHDLTVIADEVHADLTYPPAQHVPFASLGPEVEARTVTLTSVSKAFNLAGMRWAVMHMGSDAFREAIESLPGHYLGAPNQMGVVAAVAAWTAGDGWLDAVRSVLLPLPASG